MYNDKIYEQLTNVTDAIAYATFLATTETGARDLGKALVEVIKAKAALELAETNIRLRLAAKAGS